MPNKLNPDKIYGPEHIIKIINPCASYRVRIRVWANKYKTIRKFLRRKKFKKDEFIIVCHIFFHLEENSILDLAKDRHIPLIKRCWITRWLSRHDYDNIHDSTVLHNFTIAEAYNESPRYSLKQVRQSLKNLLELYDEIRTR